MRPESSARYSTPFAQVTGPVTWASTPTRHTSSPVSASSATRSASWLASLEVTYTRAAGHRRRRHHAALGARPRSAGASHRISPLSRSSARYVPALSPTPTASVPSTVNRLGIAPDVGVEPDGQGDRPGVARRELAVPHLLAGGEVEGDQAVAAGRRREAVGLAGADVEDAPLAVDRRRRPHRHAGALAGAPRRSPGTARPRRPWRRRGRRRCPRNVRRVAGHEHLEAADPGHDQAVGHDRRAEHHRLGVGSTSVSQAGSPVARSRATMRASKVPDVRRGRRRRATEPPT